MKFTFSICCTSLLFGIFSPALAATETRNGGYAIECLRPGSKTERKFYLLELAEHTTGGFLRQSDGSYAVVPQEYTVDNSVTLVQRLRKMNEKLKHVDEDFGDEFATDIETLLANTSFKQTVPPVRDDYFFIPHLELEECGEAMQIAVQIDGHRLEIRKDIWDRFDEANRTALYVHEALFRMAGRRGAIWSYGFRGYVAGALEVSELSDRHIAEWIEGVKTGFPQGHIN